jgi:hypothetical protein
MKTAIFAAFVIAGASLFATGRASAESESAGGSAGAGSSMSGMTSQGLASEPAGIGERGTGQTQSTLERSGVPAKKGMSAGQAAAEETQSAAERSGGQDSAQSQTSPSQSPSAMERPEK